MDTLAQFKNNNNFLKRVVAALILAPVLLLALLYALPWFWLEVIILLTVLAAREYWSLIPLNTNLLKLSFLGLLLLSLWACALVFPYWQTVGLILWVLILIAEWTFPSSQKYWGFSILIAGMALILWPFFIQSSAQIYFLSQGKALLIYLLFLVWAADIGAYFAGKIFGRHKLIPELSPGKSVEGVLGGIVLGLIVATIAYVYFKPYSITIWFSLAVCTLISSVVGDLCISMFKRRCNLKDTGTLIPGHGGILDRLDSLIAAAPIFYFGLTYIPLGI